MPALLTSEEAMAVLRVGRNRFWKLRKLGYLTSVDENPLLERQRRLLFRREDIERLKTEGLRKAS